MGAESSLRSRPVLTQRVAVWISLVVFFVALVLLAFAVLLGLTSSDLSPASEPFLVGPFRWGPPPNGIG
jgi:hypothetical protein